MPKFIFRSYKSLIDDDNNFFKTLVDLEYF